MSVIMDRINDVRFFMLELVSAPYLQKALNVLKIIIKSSKIHKSIKTFKTFSKGPSQGEIGSFLNEVNIEY